MLVKQACFREGVYMYDKLTEGDIKKMKEEIEYRKLTVRI